MSFAALKLIDPLLEALELSGYARPTPVQTQAIPAVLAGRDLLAAAQTGTGKTAAFALPLLQRLAAEPRAEPGRVKALVLVPTRELAEQVLRSFQAYGRFLILRSDVAYGGVPIHPQITALGRGVEILVATPGRLLDLHRQGALSLAAASTLVLDEADRMLDLGFARELDEVFMALPRQRQTLLFSATFSEEIRAMAGKLLRDPLKIEVAPRNSTAKNVKQWLVPVDKKKKPALFCHLLKQQRWGQVLVFVKTRKGVEQLVSMLQERGVKAGSIHGDKSQASRLRALESFKAGEVEVLVATDVAARGLDIDDLPLVVNFDLPQVAEDYVHRIGRTGRAGASGEAVSLVCADEVNLLAAIERLIGRGLERREMHGFEPDHRVPLTGPDARPGNKPAPGRRAGPAGKPGTQTAGRRGGKPVPGRRGGFATGIPARKPGKGRHR
ncbi:DEAD/DEAH box helicase [Azovibrio restrictus]|uniref:DEAD/DEAH box helicase n=1 Tax=Azovibrio restrictus TaxID=146938 RepID=UPI0026EE9257|nr:DEAD/DEAH box helicase [Azovibrio restrictus]